MHALLRKLRHKRLFSIVNTLIYAILTSSFTLWSPISRKQSIFVQKEEHVRNQKIKIYKMSQTCKNL